MSFPPSGYLERENHRWFTYTVIGHGVTYDSCVHAAVAAAAFFACGRKDFPVWPLVWNLLVDTAQILGGIGVLFAALEYRRWTRRQKRASFELRTFSLDSDGKAESRLTNVGAASACILSFWQRDATIEEPVASCIPSRISPGDSIDITFHGCNATSCIWIGYSSEDESDRMRFAWLPLVDQPRAVKPYSETRSPVLSDMIGIKSSRWHHGDHLSPFGKTVVWIHGLGKKRHALRELVEILSDIESQGGKPVPMQLTSKMLKDAQS